MVRDGANAPPHHEGLIVGAFDTSAAQSPRQRLNKPVGIGLIIIHMRRDAHASQTRYDVDALAGQSLDKAFRHAAVEGEAQDMWRAQMRFGNADAKAAHGSRDTLCQ